MSDPQEPGIVDPTEPLDADPDLSVIGPDDAVLETDSEEPLDRDLDPDLTDGAAADERAAREGTKGEPEV